MVSFGLAGGPATFNGAISDTLKPVNRVCALSFFDDILVLSKTLDEHVHHLRQVLQLLRKDQWFVKRSKCSFGQNQLSYLGHRISAQGVATEPSKVRAVKDWVTPTDATAVRRFLGVAGYYRRFVRHFGIIARPLFNLLKKGTPSVWTSQTEQAFQVLKQQLISAPVLALPDFTKTFVVETDACADGIGAVLQQDGHPIAFMSKSLCPRYRGLSTYEKEYLAIVVVVDQWRPYLQHAEFVIHTDQKSLVHWRRSACPRPGSRRLSLNFSASNTASNTRMAKTTQRRTHYLDRHLSNASQRSLLHNLLGSRTSSTVTMPIHKLGNSWSSLLWPQTLKVVSLSSKVSFDSETESGWEGALLCNSVSSRRFTTARWMDIPGSQSLKNAFVSYLRGLK